MSGSRPLNLSREDGGMTRAAVLQPAAPEDCRALCCHAGDHARRPAPRRNATDAEFYWKEQVLMKRLILIVVVMMLSLKPAEAQFQPFGADVERFDPSQCNPSVGCPEMDRLFAAGVQWI